LVRFTSSSSNTKKDSQTPRTSTGKPPRFASYDAYENLICKDTFFPDDLQIKKVRKVTFFRLFSPINKNNILYLRVHKNEAVQFFAKKWERLMPPPCFHNRKNSLL